MTPSDEDFARWRDDGVTRWIFAAIETGIDAQKAEWLTRSWDHGIAHDAVLQELRTRADAYRSLIDTTYQGWCEINGVEPNVER